MKPPLNQIMENKEQNNLKEEILEKIRNGSWKMKPRAYFVLRAILLSALFILFLLFAVYIVGFIFFSLRASGVIFLPGFGILGLGRMLLSLPWVLIAAAFVLIIILEIFAENFPFVYKKPLVYSLAGIIVLVLLTGFFAGKMPLHANVLRQNANVPLLGPLYGQFAVRAGGSVFNGVVDDIGENGFTMELPDGKKIKVKAGKKNPEMLKKNIQPGDQLVVLGQLENGVVVKPKLLKVGRDGQLFPVNKKHFLK